MPRKQKVASSPPTDWDTFEGFYTPHYTQTPDALFDWVMADLTGAELKVLLYIVRRTFGFKKDDDAISVEQITGGMFKRDGTRLDRGTGLARTTALEALRSLSEKRLIESERRMNEKTGSLPTVYRLRLKGGTVERTPGVGSSVPPEGAKERKPGVQKSVPTRNSDPINSPRYSETLPAKHSKFKTCLRCGLLHCLCDKP